MGPGDASGVLHEFDEGVGDVFRHVLLPFEHEDLALDFAGGSEHNRAA